MKTSGGFKPKNEILMFFLATIFFTWLLWLPALLIQNFGLTSSLPFTFFITIGTFVPSMAGFIFAYIFGGKSELRSLFKSLLNIRIGIKGLLFALLVLPLVSAVSCLIYSLSGGTLPQMQFAPWSIPLAFIYIFVLMGPLGEEAGWRGFALKNMLRNLSPIKAALLLGTLWTIWHLPLFFIDGTTQNALCSFGKTPAILAYLIYTLMISLLITLLYVMSKGSVFGSMLLHASGNLSLGIVPIIFSKSGAMILLATLFVTVSLITYKYRTVMFRKV